MKSRQQNAKGGDQPSDRSFELAAVGMAHVGIDGRFIEVNKCLCRMVGYSRDELLNKNFAEITHPDDLQTDLDMLAQMLRGEIPNYTIDKRYYRKNGDDLWVRLTVSMQRDAEGRVEHCIAVIQELDSYRQKQYIQESLNEADAARNAALHTLESIDEAAALMDLSGQIEDATPMFCHLCDHELDELRNMDIREMIEGLIDAPVDPRIEDNIIETVKTSAAEKQFDEPLPVKISDGTVRWVIPHISNIYGKDEQLAARLLVLRNVTGLKQAQMASVESERKYRELVEHANNSILRVDLDFSIQFVNRFALNFFGYAEEELLGASLLETLIPRLDPDGQDQHAAMREMMDVPELHGSYDQKNQCRDSRQIWIHWSVRAIRDPQGKVRELLLVGTDIMKRKQAEIRADFFRKRSRMLADTLIETEKRERSEMAAYLHDHIIQLLSLSNIRLGGLLPVLEEKAAANDVDRLKGVRSLLSDAVGQCRSMMDQLVPALLNDLGLGAALQHLAEKHRQLDNTEIHIKDRLDDQQLTSALASILFRSARELLMNALKYAGPCRIEIQVWYETGLVHLQVADTGVGFDMEAVDEGNYDEDGGFGLFDIRERLEGLGGNLTIESRVGEGTVASVQVPYTSAS
jgi:PAS domain S-box-containing protein